MDNGQWPFAQPGKKDTTMPKSDYLHPDFSSFEASTRSACVSAYRRQEQPFFVPRHCLQELFNKVARSPEEINLNSLRTIQCSTQETTLGVVYGVTASIIY